MKEDIKVFVSMPMHGLTTEEVSAKMDKTFRDFVNFLQKTDSKFEDCSFSLINTVTRVCTSTFGTETEKRMWYLGGSIQLLGTADMVIFAEGYKNAAGCHVEHTAAKVYNIPIYYESRISDGNFDGPFVYKDELFRPCSLYITF